MNLKKTIAMALVSAAFAMAQDKTAAPAPAAAPAEAKPVAEAKPAAEAKPVAEAPAATAPAAAPAEVAQPAPAAAPAEAAKPAEAAAPAEVAQPAEQSKASEPAAEPAAQPVAEPVAAAEPSSDSEPANLEAPVSTDGSVWNDPVHKAPPKTPFTVLHGNAYNRVANEAAADNVDVLLNKRLTKMPFYKFFYIEPSGEKGAFSLGNFFGAMDISGELGRATAGYATPGFAVEARVGLGQIKTDTKKVDVKETVEGDDWGLTLSKTFRGYTATLAGDWITYAKETNTDRKKGAEIEQRYRDIEASLILTNGPSAQKHFWSTGLAFTRHENEVEVNGTLMGDSLTSNFSIVPVFNYGSPVVRTSYANFYMGVNAAVPLTVYDKADMLDTNSGKFKESSLTTVALNLTPNILGEVLLGESLMLFGEASYTWEALRYIKKETPYDEIRVKRSVADKVEASMGLRYQYKDWAACEFAFGDSFFTDTKSIFNGEGVFVSFGGFIYF